jgi:WD40 repeat protein
MRTAESRVRFGVTAVALAGAACSSASSPSGYAIRQLAAIHDPGFGFSIAFSPDGRMLASGDTDGYARLWDVSDPARPKLLATLPTGSSFSSTDYSGATTTVAFSPDGRLLAVSDPAGTVALWNVTDPAQPTTAGLIQVLPRAPANEVPQNSLTAFAFGSDGIAATGDQDGDIRLWNISDPASPVPLSLVHQVQGESGPPVFALAFSQDANLAVLASGSTEAQPAATVDLWDVADPAAPQPMVLSQGGDDPGAAYSLAFRRDSGVLAAGLFSVASHAPALSLWNVTDDYSATAQLVGPGVVLAEGGPFDEAITPEDARITGLSFSADGRLLAAANADAATVRLWNVSNLGHLVSLDGPVGVPEVTTLAFSPVASILATRGKDIRLWQVPPVP